MKQVNKNNNQISVRYHLITGEEEGQRIDNFLITKLKGVPKSRIYNMLRKGEVRVNMKRISPFYRLRANDSLRIPPVVLAEKAKQVPPSKQTINVLTERVLYEDDNLLILNKPSGMSVHAGSTVRMGVIEALRYAYPTISQLELAHRLDTETSGCLILAKKRRILREIHELLREGRVIKKYWTVTQGEWLKSERLVDLSLQKNYRHGDKYCVQVSKAGKSALSEFSPIKVFSNSSLVEVHLLTGRTHQIRVHAMAQGHPIAGDDRYGNAEFNKLVRQQGLRRMFLHARSIDFTLPSLEQRITVIAPLDTELEAYLRFLDNEVP